MILLCTRVFANVVTTKRQINPGVQRSSSSSQSAVQRKLAHNIKNCIPYSESTTFDVSGVNIIFDIKIAGWINNKCRMDFTSNATGASSSFKSLYGIDSSQAEIMAFAPKFRCEFSKQQLAEAGDSILQEEERKHGAGNNMLKHPDNIDITQFANMSSNDMKLLSMLTDGTTCKMLNTEDLNGIINSLFGY